MLSNFSTDLAVSPASCDANMAGDPAKNNQELFPCR